MLITSGSQRVNNMFEYYFINLYISCKSCAVVKILVILVIF